MITFESLKGKIIISISGFERYSEAVLFETSDGKKYKMYHEQECCENVYVEDIAGDIQDIVGSEILLAEEAGGEKQDQEEYGTLTWTFYKLSTIKGSITIRWYGSSNGYYSENVSFKEMNI